MNGVNFSGGATGTSDTGGDTSDNPFDDLVNELVKLLAPLATHRHLNKCEKEAIANHKNDLFLLQSIIDATNKADEEEAKIRRAYGFPKEGDGDFPNAVKHCVWNCEMSRRTRSPIVAQEFGDGHECNKSGSALMSDANSLMDQNNNKVGRNLSDQEGSCTGLCIQSKDIYWINGEGHR